MMSYRVRVTTPCLVFGVQARVNPVPSCVLGLHVFDCLDVLCATGRA